MGIFSRMSDIVNSNLNAMLDRAEEPQKMVRLMIREMEDTLIEVRSQAARTIAERKEIDRRTGQLDRAAAEWDRKAEMAVTKGREDLAKAALAEKAKLVAALDALQAELDQLEDAMSAHSTDIAQLDAKLVEARAKEQALLSRHVTAKSRLKVRKQLNQKRVRDAFSRFEAMEQRLDRAEGEVEAYDLGQRKTLAEELADIETEDDIEKELAAIKARLAGKKKTGAPVHEETD